MALRDGGSVTNKPSQAAYVVCTIFHWRAYNSPVVRVARLRLHETGRATGQRPARECSMVIT